MPMNTNDKQYYLNMFITNYNKIKEELNCEYVMKKVYNKYKPVNSPSANTITKYVGVKRYLELIDLSKVNEPEPLTFNVNIDLLGYDELLDLNNILYEITNRTKKQKNGKTK